MPINRTCVRTSFRLVKEFARALSFQEHQHLLRVTSIFAFQQRLGRVHTWSKGRHTKLLRSDTGYSRPHFTIFYCRSRPCSVVVYSNCASCKSCVHINTQRELYSSTVIEPSVNAALENLAYFGMPTDSSRFSFFLPYKRCQHIMQYL